MNVANNFNISSLLIFAGVASAILTNTEIQRDFNHKNPYSVVAVLFIIGTISILIYGGSGDDGKFGASIFDKQIDITFLGAGYFFILLGTILLLYICIRNAVVNYRQST